jgi:hypothetical protein
VAGLALLDFYILFHQQYDFLKELLNIKGVLMFSTTFVRNISHSTKNSAKYYRKYTQVFIKVLFFSLTDCFRNSQISNFVKIRLLGAVLFHVDRQTDGQTYRQTNRYDKANSRFGSFAKAPRNQQAIRNVDGELEQHFANVPA